MRSNPNLFQSSIIEKFIRMLGFGLMTTIKNLYTTNHKWISSTGLIVKRFKTDKSQLQYKQLYHWYCAFYVDYLKVGFKSVKQFIGENVYTDKHGFKKLLPWSNETSEGTGHTLRGLVELVGLPSTLHSENHKNFKKGLFNQLLQNFGIIPTYMDPHLT